MRSCQQSPPGITDLATLTFRHEERFFHPGSIEEQYVKKIMPVKLQLALKYSRSRTPRSDLEILIRAVLGLGAPSAAWKDAKIDPTSQSMTDFFRETLRRLLTEILDACPFAKRTDISADRDVSLQRSGI